MGKITPVPITRRISRLLFALAALSAMFDTQNQPNVDSYLPQRVLSSSSFKTRSDRPAWCEYHHSSTTGAFLFRYFATLSPLVFLFLAPKVSVGYLFMGCTICSGCQTVPLSNWCPYLLILCRALILSNAVVHEEGLLFLILFFQKTSGMGTIGTLGYNNC